MRIVCPSCSAEYDVPEARLTPRKMVRCSQCGGEWIASPASDDPGEEMASEPAEPIDDLSPQPMLPAPRVSAMDRLVASVRNLPERTPLIVAWVLTGVVLIAAVAAVMTWREAVVRAWPPSSRVLGHADHASLGLHPSGPPIVGHDQRGGKAAE